MPHHKQAFSQTLKSWLPLAVLTLIFSATIYVSVQQSYRSNANDPQIQIAQDIASALAQGEPAASIVPATGTTDLSKTLAPYVMIYDDSGKILGSSVQLDGKNPDFPSAVLDNVKKSGEERVTWQPKPGLRFATVVEHFTGKQAGFVVAGRSLKEVEARINQLTTMVALAMALALVLSFLLMLLLAMMGKKPNEHEHEHHHEHEHGEDSPPHPENH